MGGTVRFASNYMLFDGAPGAVGGTIVAVWITQWVYTMHAGQDGKCRGEKCFFFTYLLIAVLQLVGVVLVVRLSMKSKLVYGIISQPSSLTASLPREGMQAERRSSE